MEEIKNKKGKEVVKIWQMVICKIYITLLN